MADKYHNIWSLTQPVNCPDNISHTVNSNETVILKQSTDMFINIKNLEKIKLDSNDDREYTNFSSSIKMITKTNIDELQKNIKNDANMVKDGSLNYILEYKNIKDYNFINYYKSYINSIIFYELPITETYIYKEIFNYNEDKNALFFNTKQENDLKEKLKAKDIYKNIEKIYKLKDNIDVLNNLIYDLSDTNVESIGRKVFNISNMILNCD